MESLEDRIAFVEGRIWDRSREELECLRPALEADLAARSVLPRRLLEGLPDECLALAIQKEFWWVDAFAELFVRRYEEKLTRWFYRWRVKHQDAQEIIQELYQRFLENQLKTYDANYNFAGYLYRAARHLYIEKGRKSALPTTSLPADAPASRKDDPADELAGKEMDARLDAAMKGLTLIQQSVIRLIRDDSPPRDIAERLGVPIRQVYSQLFHARRRLEQLLDLEPHTRCYIKRETDVPITPSQFGDGEVMR